MTLASIASDTAHALRIEVRREHGLLVLTKAELRDRLGMKRLRSSPAGKGTGAAKLTEVLSAARLGALPIGRETETRGGRTAEGFSEGVFGELTGLRDQEFIALFDKECPLGRVLLLAGNRGPDYQTLASELQPDFPAGVATSAEGIRDSADRNGGFVVVRQATLLGNYSGLDETELLTELEVAGLVPLPVRGPSPLAEGLQPDVSVLLAMSADDLVGVVSRNGLCRLNFLVWATTAAGDQAQAAGVFALVAKENMFKTGSPWLVSNEPGSQR